ncbi:MAG TPA: glycogen synthase [Anaerolineaceae bacterium]|nr:glycogen synthase [Anaerolineaceae bacterium]
MRILFLSAEIDPLIKIGGLGDVAGSLPAALRALPADRLNGQTLDVRVAIPFYPAVRRTLPDLPLVAQFEIQRAGQALEARVYRTDMQGVPVYLIAGPPVDGSDAVYTGNNCVDGDKFYFYSLAALELVKKLDWVPDILHANDWHTAPAAYALFRRRKLDPFFQDTKIVLGIHNLPFMGAGCQNSLEDYGLKQSYSRLLPSWAQRVPLPLGMIAADHIVAVSPSYGREILTPEQGFGLETLLLSRRQNVSGILNGIDTQYWDPANDQAIATRFSADDLLVRVNNKLALLNEFKLNPKAEIPLLVLVSRMDIQKGVDLAIEGLRLAKKLEWQAILLGSGNPDLEAACVDLQKEMPDRVRVVTRFDALLSRRMYAGGDILLMPSRYEPCGLSQMIGMRYGCVPLARATGGLVDTVFDLPEINQSTGFLFKELSGKALAKALDRAIRVYHNQNDWKRLQINGMRKDYSWEGSALQYAHLYLKLSGKIPFGEEQEEKA